MYPSDRLAAICPFAFIISPIDAVRKAYGVQSESMTSEAVRICIGAKILRLPFELESQEYYKFGAALSEHTLVYHPSHEFPPRRTTSGPLSFLVTLSVPGRRLRSPPGNPITNYQLARK